MNRDYPVDNTTGAEVRGDFLNFSALTGVFHSIHRAEDNGQK
jgi:hypothetical protein